MKVGILSTWRSSSMTSSIVITPTTSWLEGISGIGVFSKSKIQNEQPLCLFLKAGVGGGDFFGTWSSSALCNAVLMSCELDFGVVLSASAIISSYNN